MSGANDVHDDLKPAAGTTPDAQTRRLMRRASDDALPSPETWATARAAYRYAWAPAQLLPRLRADYASEHARRDPMMWRWFGPTAAAAIVLVVMLLVGMPRQLVVGSHQSRSVAAPATAPVTPIATKRSEMVVASSAAAARNQPAADNDPAPALRPPLKAAHDGPGHLRTRAASSAASRSEWAVIDAVGSGVSVTQPSIKPAVIAQAPAATLSALPLAAPPPSTWLTMPSPPSVPSLSGLQLPAYPSSTTPPSPAAADDRADATAADSAVTA